jgi:hypothetical protein
MRSGEADVRIIMRETRAAVLEPQRGTSPGRRATTSPAASIASNTPPIAIWWKKRASRSSPLWSRKKRQPILKRRAKSPLAAEKRPGGAETGKVRRFLKALTGD